MSDEATASFSLHGWRNVTLDVEVETLASALNVTPDEIRQAVEDQEGDLWRAVTDYVMDHQNDGEITDEDTDLEDAELI